MFVTVALRDTGALIEGPFLANDQLARVMFDSGATHSFIDHNFILELGFQLKCLDLPLQIAIPVGRSIIID